MKSKRLCVLPATVVALLPLSGAAQADCDAVGTTCHGFAWIQHPTTFNVAEQCVCALS